MKREAGSTRVRNSEGLNCRREDKSMAVDGLRTRQRNGMEV